MEYYNIIKTLKEKNILKHTLEDVIELGNQLGILQSIYYCIKNNKEEVVSDVKAYQTPDIEILHWLKLEFGVV